MNPTPTKRFPLRRSKSGQIMVIYGLLLPVMFFFMGLGVDSGLMYLTKAKLSRSVDGVALRLARKYTSDDGERENIALSIMQANYGGFLAGASWTASGSLSGSDGQTMTSTSTVNGQTLTVNTKSNNATAVVTVKVTAEVDHYTYFMPLANIKKVHFSDTATAERFPACNVLILDNSGSMSSNGGSTNMGPAVKAFLNEFDEDRDYLLMVGFNYTAAVLWPPVNEGVATDANGNVYIQPSRGFLTGSSGGSTLFTKSALTVADSLPFGGNTNAAAGVRLAAYNTDIFYNTLDDLAKSKIKFNYVFMTDGTFNGAPTYVQGYGFGYTGKRTYYITTGSGRSQVTTGPFNAGDVPEKGATATSSQMPSWHFFKPVYNGKVTSSESEYKDRDGNNYVFKWYTTAGALRSSYTLASKINSAPGIDLTTGSPTPCIAGFVCSTSPGQNSIYVAYSAAKDSQVSTVPAISTSSGGTVVTGVTTNNTAKGFDNYNTGKTWSGDWTSSQVKLSYYYTSFAFPSEITPPVPSNPGVAKSSNVDNTTAYWKQWYSFLDGGWQTGTLGGTDSGFSIVNVPNWTALANVSYVRNIEKATWYAVGFDQADEEIMRNIANQKSDGTALDTNESKGKYYQVTNASDLTTTFRDIARQIAVRLSE